MKITLLVPCYNEEKTICKSVESWLDQTRPADEILIVDDSSTDRTAEFLKPYADRVKLLKTSENMGNKSYAQEYGLSFVDGEVLVVTDGDTLLDRKFIEEVAKDFSDPKVVAMSGYVKSLPYNWLTSCRALEYSIGQNIDKLAQDYLDYLTVIPGAAGAFRTSIFRAHLNFDHDTLTEDLDTTYKLHELGYKIKYNRKAICYTQDPPNLRSYVTQIRRWYGGGWQNLMKHMSVPQKPGMAFELTLLYLEGLLFSSMLLLMTALYSEFLLEALGFYTLILYTLAIYCYRKEKRSDLFFVVPLYVLLRYVNAWIFIEQFFKQVIFKKNSLVWSKADRVKI